jgi:hypothetical protein
VRFNLLGISIFTMVLAGTASAQDFGTQWIDRVTHQLIEEQGPLNPRPLDVHASVGEIYSYDTNLFLTNTNRERDSIFTTFGSVGLTYAQPSFDAEADLTVNYNAYVHNDDASTDEERFFGRIRYQGSQITIGLAEIVRRESSPTDVVFTTRVQRFLSNTTPLIVYQLSSVVALEAQSDLQIVRYLRKAFQTADNFNTRSSLTGAYKTGWNDLDALLQVGYFSINYRLNTAPPDATGYFARTGVRGEISPNLHLLTLVGITHASSSDFVGTSQNVELNTADLEFHLAYTVTELVTAYADYSRRFGFGVGGAPFEVVDSADVILRYSVRDDFALKGRVQYDRAHPVPGAVRAYSSISAGAEYRILEHLLLEGQITYRVGSSQAGSSGAGDFGDGILSVGVVGTF